MQNREDEEKRELCRCPCDRCKQGKKKAKQKIQKLNPGKKFDWKQIQKETEYPTNYRKQLRAENNSANFIPTIHRKRALPVNSTFPQYDFGIPTELSEPNDSPSLSFSIEQLIDMGAKEYRGSLIPPHIYFDGTEKQVRPTKRQKTNQTMTQEGNTIKFCSID